MDDLTVWMTENWLIVLVAVFFLFLVLVIKPWMDRRKNKSKDKKKKEPRVSQAEQLQKDSRRVLEGAGYTRINFGGRYRSRTARSPLGKRVGFTLQLFTDKSPDGCVKIEGKELSF